jgi:hypothetical protein
MRNRVSDHRWTLGGGFPSYHTSGSKPICPLAA